jgi:hypothetical protein
MQLQISFSELLSIAGLLFVVFGALIGTVWAMLNSKINRIQQELDKARDEIKEYHKVEITVAEFGAVYIPREEADRRFTEVFDRVNELRGG